MKSSGVLNSYKKDKILSNSVWGDRMAQPMNSEHKRIFFIDILKSLACICVMIGHVINGMIKDGMDVSVLLRTVNSYVYLFHVPCFFFASGYLYANQRLDKWNEYPKFLLKK